MGLSYHTFNLIEPNNYLHSESNTLLYKYFRLNDPSDTEKKGLVHTRMSYDEKWLGDKPSIIVVFQHSYTIDNKFPMLKFNGAEWNVKDFPYFKKNIFFVFCLQWQYTSIWKTNGSSSKQLLC